MVMIKDNHISVAGGIANAMKSVDQFLEKEKVTIPVEVLFSDGHVEKGTYLRVYVLIFLVYFFCLV